MRNRTFPVFLFAALAFAGLIAGVTFAQRPKDLNAEEARNKAREQEEEIKKLIEESDATTKALKKDVEEIERRQDELSRRQAADVENEVRRPKGPAPLFLWVREVGEDYVAFDDVGPMLGITGYQRAFKEIEAFDAKGRILTEQEFRKRVKVGTVVLAAVDQKRVDPAFLAIVNDDTLVLVGVVERLEAKRVKR